MSEYLSDSSQPAPASLPELRRLGGNHNGYNGERIDIRAIIEDCESAARAHGWQVDRIDASLEMVLPAFFRPSAESGHRPLNLYISAGIHGDEPATPLAARRLLQEDFWPPFANVWMCPCLNPTGFMANRRENEHGMDLNREYLHPQAKETIAHIAWMETQPSWDLCLCLHEDWESHGFYLYELNPECRPSFSRQILDAVAQVCPIDRSETIEGRPANEGLIMPKLDIRSRLQWPEAFFLVMRKTRLCYTFEAPSDFPLQPRVEALVVAVRSAIRGYSGFEA